MSQLPQTTPKEDAKGGLSSPPPSWHKCKMKRQGQNLYLLTFLNSDMKVVFLTKIDWEKHPLIT